MGVEEPPSRRLASCQRCFRTTDIDEVGNTARHLTFFEMLGNFSVGDYFKEGAVEFALDLSTNGFGFDFERIWITVFGGDDELGLGPDEEAVECWLSVGVPRERIVLLGREDNFWQSGPTGPCGPCSELYLDRGDAFGPDTDRPGDDTATGGGIDYRAEVEKALKHLIRMEFPCFHPGNRSRLAAVMGDIAG
jgi:alanyl-tRNA synthetase